MKTAWLLTALSVVAFGCADDPRLDSDAGTDAGTDAGPDGGEPVVPRCAPDCAYDATAYHLRASFDWQANQLIASEDITLSVTPGEAYVVLDAAVAIASVHSGELELPFRSEDSTLAVDLSTLDDGSGTVQFTVDYVTELSESLIRVGPVEDDLVLGEVVYTVSENAPGYRWLITNYEPADRALFSIELTLAEGEDLVANGERIRDEATDDGGRVVGYALDTPIAPYSMAFAVGDLEQTTPTSGDSPLSIWHRRGLVLDEGQAFDALERLMTLFTELLGPYPWASYSVVLLPDYRGAMENTTINFFPEETATGVLDEDLLGHELAHEWFGNWVTIASLDDLWIKEGMATLLQGEAAQLTANDPDTDRQYGWWLFFYDGDAIVDRTLEGTAHFTTGPYGRAAWTLGQLRFLIGDEAFWSVLRGVLETHGAGSLDTATFLDAFAPHLDEATLAHLATVFEVHETPTLSFAREDLAAAAQVTIDLDDPHGTFLVPLQAVAVDADGVATTHEVVAGTSLVIEVPTGGYLALDEHDLHPEIETFVGEGYAEIASLLVPTAPGALATFLARTPGNQNEALFHDQPTDLDPAAFANLYANVGGDNARHQALSSACALVATLAPEEAAPWYALLPPLLQVAPDRAFYDVYFSRCGDVPTLAFAEELAAINTSVEASDMARAEHLLSYNYGPVQSLELIAPIAFSSPSRWVRGMAIDRLAGQAMSETNAPAPELRGPWKAFFRRLFAEHRATSLLRVYYAWYALIGLEDAEGLIASAIVFDGYRDDYGYDGILLCDAYAALDESQWAALTATLVGAELQDSASAVIADPVAECR